MYFLHAINSDRQTRLLNVLGQITMILGEKQILLSLDLMCFVLGGTNYEFPNRNFL